MTDQELDARVESTDLSAGRWLAKARKDHNLSIADVAGKLRLAPRQIEAIEADDYQRLPGRTIVRGFVRNYAKLLQLDPVQLVAAYDKSVPADDGPRISLPHQNVQFSEVDRGHRNRSTLWMTLGLGVLIGLGFIAWWWEGKSATASNPAAEITIPHSPNAAATSALPANPIPVSPEPAPVTEPVQAAVVPATPNVTQPADPVPPSIAENVVHLAFEGKSFVEVRDGSGKVVMKKSNPAGTELDITAPLPLSFTVGNAAKVKMTHNGEAIDLTPHMAGNVARFKLEP
jgi:cytoskeleton protein RodZ